MRGSDEKQKVFSSVFYDAMTGMGFSCKDDVFYRYSKINGHVIELFAEFYPDGSIYDVSIGFGSNYAPIKCKRSELSLLSSVGITQCIATFDEAMRKESENMNDKEDSTIITDYLEKTVLPAFIEKYASMLNSVTSLREYLKLEELLIEQDCQVGYGIEKGACEETAWGYLALGDKENAQRICHKVQGYLKNYMRQREKQYSDDAEAGKCVIENVKKRINSAITIESQIASGSMEGLLLQAAERNNQSIEACAKFFGEDLYLSS